MDTYATLRRLATDMFGIPTEPLLRARTLSDAGISPFAASDLVFAIEARFSIAIPIEEVSGVRSLRDLAVVVDRLTTRNTPEHDE